MQIETTVTLCVLLWAHEGRERALIGYEDRVLELVAAHRGTVLRRARTSGSGSEPLEIQLLQFPSQRALDQYMGDERRAGLAADRAHAVARTQVLRVDLV